MRASRLIAAVGAASAAMTFAGVAQAADKPATTVQEFDQADVSDSFQNPWAGVVRTLTLVTHTRLESTDDLSLFRADTEGTLELVPTDPSQPRYTGTVDARGTPPASSTPRPRPPTRWPSR